MKAFIRFDDVKPFAERFAKRLEDHGVSKEDGCEAHGFCVRWLHDVLHPENRRKNSRGNRPEYTSANTVEKLLIALDEPWRIHEFTEYRRSTKRVDGIPRFDGYKEIVYE